MLIPFFPFSPVLPVKIAARIVQQLSRICQRANHLLPLPLSLAAPPRELPLLGSANMMQFPADVPWGETP
jgi:hypothetical protein